uniref:Uncharacterized protein n=1 Tax=Bactrocera dorsalis TaxID=27457 RepID=A0A034VZJ2_BACDO
MRVLLSLHISSERRSYTAPARTVFGSAARYYLCVAARWAAYKHKKSLIVTKKCQQNNCLRCCVASVCIEIGNQNKNRKLTVTQHFFGLHLPVPLLNFVCL